MTDCANFENIVFWHDQASINSFTLTSSTSAVNHPVTEIQNQSVKLTWRSTTSALSYVEGNGGAAFLGSTKKAGFVFVNHNFDTGTNIRVELWNGAAKIFDDLFDGRLFAPTSVAEVPPYQNRVLYIDQDFPFVTRWRCSFSGSAATHYEVGMMFCGTAFQPTNAALDDGIEIIPVDNSKVQLSKGKDQFIDVDPKSRGLSISMNRIEDLNLLEANPNNNFSEWARLIFNTGSRNAVFVDPFPRTELMIPGINYRLINAISQMYGSLFANGGIRPTSINTAIVPTFKLVEAL